MHAVRIHTYMQTEKNLKKCQFSPLFFFLQMSLIPFCLEPFKNVPRYPDHFSVVPVPILGVKDGHRVGVRVGAV